MADDGERVGVEAGGFASTRDCMEPLMSRVFRIGLAVSTMARMLRRENHAGNWLLGLGGVDGVEVRASSTSATFSWVFSSSFVVESWADSVSETVSEVFATALDASVTGSEAGTSVGTVDCTTSVSFQYM